MAKKKKMFLDVEMTGLHQITTLISIALVCEDGNEYYAELTDYDKLQIDDFLREHVLSKRILDDYDFAKNYDPDAKTVYVKGDIELVKETLTHWLSKYEDDGIEIWGDVYAYDWVLFVSVFGNAFDVPKHVYYIPMDLATTLKLFGEDPDVSREIYAYGEDLAKINEAKKHNALFDAQTSLEVFKKLLYKSKENEKKEEKEEGSVDTKVATEEVKEEIKEEDRDAAEAAKTWESGVMPQKEDEAVRSDVNSEKHEFVEPTQEDLDNSEEFHPPI